MNKNSRGLTPILIVVILGIIGIIGYLVLKAAAPSPSPSTAPAASQEPNGNLADLPRDEVLRGWKTYTNLQDEYSLKYPEFYEIEELGIFGSEAKEVRLLHTDGDRRIRILKLSNTERGTLEELAKGLYFVNTYGQEPVVGKDISFEKTRVADTDSLKVYGIGDDFVILLPMEDKVYQFSVTGFSDNKTVNEFNQILSTFRFLDDNSETTQPLTGEGCVVGGCNGELCQDADEEPLASICIFRPEYVCYKTAVCERQANDKCGWIQTEELEACLAQYQN